MFAGIFDGPEIIIVLVVVLVLFGGSQIPKLARNLGQAQKEFKKGIADGSAEDGTTPSTTTQPTTTQPTTTQPPTEP